MISRKTIAQKRMDKRKKGFTLTEIAIVLGIIGLILGAIWVAASSVYSNQRTARANQSVLQIVQGARALFATSAGIGNSGAADITSTIIAAAIIPSDLVQSTSSASGQWPGSTLKVLAPATGDSFTVEFNKIPQSACISLLQTVGGTGRDQGLFAVDSSAASAPVAQGTAGTAVTTGASPTQVAVVTPTAATAGCTAGAPNTSLAQFAFTLK